jgi:hypothetical protein
MRWNPVCYVCEVGKMIQVEVSRKVGQLRVHRTVLKDREMQTGGQEGKIERKEEYNKVNVIILGAGDVYS